MTHRQILTASALALALAFGHAGAAGAAGDAAPAAAEKLQVKAPAGVYVMDPTHASLTFSFLHNGISHYTARFNRLSGEVTLDPASPEKSSVTVTIDTASVDASYPADYKAAHPGSAFSSWSEDIARNSNYLNADKFPTAVFRSTRVEQTGPRAAKVTGDLTFLGVTRPVTLDVTFVGELEKHPFLQQPAIGFSATGSFRRSDFGMPVGFVGDEVTVRFDGEFIRKAGQK